MNQRMINIVLSVAFCAVMVAAAFYLNSEPSDSESADGDLKKAVNTLWEAKLAKNWGTVYDLSSDEFHKRVKRDTFVSKANLNITSFSVKDIQITEPGKAVALIDYTIEQMGYKFNLKDKKENWIHENGKWHQEIKPMSFPGTSNKEGEKP